MYKINSLFFTLLVTLIVSLLWSFYIPVVFNPFSDPPGAKPKLFGPSVISDGYSNRDMAISPSGDELFYTLQNKNNLSVILHAKKMNNKWSKPEVAFFSGTYNDLEPAFSPDGRRLYFSSKRPVKNNDVKKDYDIWYTEKIKNQWLVPVHLPAPVNSDKDEFYPSVTKNGDIYYTLDVGENKEDIVVARKNRNGGYDEPVSLPAVINSMGYEFNAFVDPDEKFILFTGYNRKDGAGNGDIYISEKDASGNWLGARNPGAGINSEGLDYCPFVSADRKYLFFTSNRTVNGQPYTERKSLKEIHQIINNAGNGNDDIYWVDMNALLNK